MQKISGGFAISVIVVVSMFLIGVFAMIERRDEIIADQAASLEAAVPAETVSNGADDILIYENKRFGIRFSYPRDMEVREDGDTIHVVFVGDPTAVSDASGNLDIVLFQNDGSKNLKEWFDSTFDKQANKDCGEWKDDADISVSGNGYTRSIGTDAQSVPFGTVKSCANAGTYTNSPDKSRVLLWKIVPSMFPPSDMIFTSFEFMK